MAFGDYGLKAVERGQLTARQIEAARRAMTRFVKRGGKIWIRVFPDKPITKKPLEVRQGKGKGNVEYWVAQIKPGKLLYEIAGVTEEVAREAFTLAAAKLPLEHHLRRTASRLMKAKEQRKAFREKSDAELGEELLKLRREQFNLRMQSRDGSGREARPARQGAQVDRALEDRAARAREEVASKRYERSRDTKQSLRNRRTVGRVVSNKMQKSVTVSVERLVQAPGLRQVHSAHHARSWRTTRRARAAKATRSRSSSAARSASARLGESSRSSSARRWRPSRVKGLP